jgi:very-short-patch-repair endonuclease
MRKQSRQKLKFQAVLAERAHCMRHNMTETEAQLWRQLAGGALGVAFRRQVPIDRHIVDFLAPPAKLVVEVDGGVHSVLRARDARRDRTLSRLGYRVVPIPAELVRSNVAGAVGLIVATLRTAI